MKLAYCVLMLLCASMVASAQSAPDSADIFFNHLNLDEVVVTSPVGQIKRKQSATPISVVTQKTLRQTASSNIIDAVAKEPGVAQVTTGSGISKPVIRGLGYNRIVTIADGVRQEGQQWGDEHGIEIDGQSVGQVEILKGPASLMYGSDAMAGVLIFHPEAIEPAGRMAASLATEYQTNSGLINYSLRFGGNKKGFVWNGRYSEKFAHAYHNKYDGYVPGTQFHERAVNALLGMNKTWGFTSMMTTNPLAATSAPTRRRSPTSRSTTTKPSSTTPSPSATASSKPSSATSRTAARSSRSTTTKPLRPTVHPSRSITTPLTSPPWTSSSTPSPTTPATSTPVSTPGNSRQASAECSSAR